MLDIAFSLFFRQMHWFATHTSMACWHWYLLSLIVIFTSSSMITVIVIVEDDLSINGHVIWNFLWYDNINLCLSVCFVCVCSCNDCVTLPSHWGQNGFCVYGSIMIVLHYKAIEVKVVCCETTDVAVSVFRCLIFCKLAFKSHLGKESHISK